MTEGTSQGLFIVVAVVIFGIFVSLSYTLFGSNGLTNDLVTIFEQAFGKGNGQGSFDKDSDYNVEGVIPNAETDFVFDGVNTIIGYIGESKEVVIPKTINNKEVTTINGSAFNNKELTKVIMPNTLTTIKDGSLSSETPEGLKTVIGGFANNNIQEISFSANIEYIGSFAFFAGNLDEAILPEGLEQIGESAFEDNKLTDIYIPSTVTNLGETAFKDNNISDVTYGKSSGETNPVSVGNGAFIGNSLGSVSIPKGTTSIPEGAYQDSGLTGVKIPNGVKTIGKDSFANNKLAKVEIPETVTEINEGAFKENSLTEVNLPNGLTSIGNYAFYKNLLPVVSLPESLLNIGTHAFNYNKLLDVTIPSKLKVIKEFSFANNKMPKKPSIPSNVITEEKNAFFGNLFSEENPNYPVEGSVVVTDPKSFSFNTTSRTITSYKGKESDIVIPYEIGGVPVEHIGDFAFNRFNFSGKNVIDLDIKSVVIPNTIKTIGDYAFHGKTTAAGTINISKVKLGHSITSIGEGAFGYANMDYLSIPNSVISIGNSSFGNSKLTSLSLGNSIKTIGSNAFNSSNLTELTLPKTIRTVGQNAFGKDNTSLVNVYAYDINNSTLANDSTSIFGVNSRVIYEKPYKFNSNTKTITNYGGKGGNVVIPDSIDGVPVENIGNAAFNRADFKGKLNRIYVDISSVSIPDTVKTIGNQAFSGDGSSLPISKINIGKNVEVIGEGAFSFSNTTEIIIPNNVRTIGGQAFLGNKASTLSLGNSVETIGFTAFSDARVKDLIIPKSVKSISYYAFYSYSIESIIIKNTKDNIKLDEKAFSDSKVIPQYIP